VRRFADFKPEDRDKVIALYANRVDPVDLLPLQVQHRRRWVRRSSHRSEQRSIGPDPQVRRKHALRTCRDQDGSSLQRPPHSSRNHHHQLARSARAPSPCALIDHSKRYTGIPQRITPSPPSELIGWSSIEKIVAAARTIRTNRKRNNKLEVRVTPLPSCEGDVW
jgi:hypothetical protein